jgi:molybdate transport system substrate-binding protein
VTATLSVLSAGAAKYLVQQMLGPFEAEHGVRVDATFGAVGAMRQALLDGAACDVMITSESMHGRLASEGHLPEGGYSDIGQVPTAVAIRLDDLPPDVSTVELLSECFRGADAVYCPDIDRATAGIHLASVLKRLGIYEEIRPRLRVFPNGAAAMAELARSRAAHPIGCTQMTEIIYTAGTEVAGELPSPFALTTAYRAVGARQPADRELAAQFIETLTGPRYSDLRQRAGFRTV